MLSKSDFKYHTLSLKGIDRSYNQDDLYMIHTMNYSLYVLFDGVSSYDDSKMVVNACKEYISSWYSVCLKEVEGLSCLIYNMNLFAIKLPYGGKTTCSALLLDYRKQKAIIVNIGDSRVYALSNTYMEQITKDDNLPGHKNILSRYIGMSELEYIDFKEIKIDLNQNFLLCTDGFYNLMHMNLKKYFKVFQFKRNLNLVNAILKLQTGINNDDSTFILVKNNAI